MTERTSEKVAVDESLPWPRWVPLLDPSDVLKSGERLGGTEVPHDLPGWADLVAVGPLHKDGARRWRRGVSGREGRRMLETIHRALLVELGLRTVRQVEHWGAGRWDVEKANDDPAISTRRLAGAWNRAMRLHLGYSERVASR